MRNLFSLRTKLIVAFMIVAALVGAVSVYQMQSINRFNALFTDLIDNDFHRLDQLETVRFYTFALEQQAFANIQDMANGETIDVAAERTALTALLQSMRNSENNYVVLLHDDSDKQNKSIGEITAKTEVLGALAGSILDQKVTPSRAELEKVEEELKVQRQELTQLLNAAIVNENREIRQEKAGADAATTRIINLNIVFAAATAAFALGLGLLVASLIARSLNKVKAGAERVANGDFSRSIDVTSHDEVGQLAQTFNDMAVRLRDSYNRLALERQRDEIMLESMSDGLIAINDEGHITLVNSKAAEMLDIETRSTLMGRPLDQELVVYDKNDKQLDPNYSPARAALDGGTPITDIFTYHKQGGSKIILNITMSPVGLEGKERGVIMVIRDVTREMQVDRMKTEFISLASHQLRTPLSAIKWFTEMLIAGDAGKLSSEQMDFAKNVADSTERMIQLVSSLLNISRMESGRIMIDPKPTDLHELVSGIVNDLKAKTVERRQNLVVSVHDGLPKVSLDARLIGQVYMNLLTNAIKYTPKGGEISVFVSRKGDELVSQVTDNGYGIPKAEHHKMFQKFFRAANVAKVETDGTGLGLYLIKAIIESSGGKIWFESEEGKGTTFWFSLPMSGMKAKEGEVTLDN